MTSESNNPQETGQFEGRYSNAFQVGYNAFEVLLDFGQFSPESAQARFHTRIITSPFYAKVLCTLLRESVERYEETFGVIPEQE